QPARVGGENPSFTALHDRAPMNFGAFDCAVAAASLHFTPHAALGLHLLYLSPSCLWWQAVADIIGVKSSTALRTNSRCTWRHRAGARNVSNTVIRRALSPLRPCGSVPADVHGCPRGVTPLRHPLAIRDHPVATREEKRPHRLTMPRDTLLTPFGQLTR